MRVGLKENIFQTVENDPHWDLRSQIECLTEPHVGNQSTHHYSRALGFMAQVHPSTEMLSTKKILNFGLSGFGNICTYMVRHL